jgi:hypothetical protein
MVRCPPPRRGEEGRNAPAELNHTPCVLDLGSFRKEQGEDVQMDVCYVPGPRYVPWLQLVLGRK